MKSLNDYILERLVLPLSTWDKFDLFLHLIPSPKSQPLLLFIYYSSEMINSELYKGRGKNKKKTKKNKKHKRRNQITIKELKT